MKLNNQLVRFLLLIGSTYAVWFVLYEFWLKPQGKLDHFVTEQVTIGVCNMLRWTGYECWYTIALKWGETYIFIPPAVLPAVRVGASCNGLELLALFALFIACYPGKWLLKIPYIAGGLLLIHLLNILRNYWLTLMSIHSYAHYEFFHRYVFIFMVYGFIFGLWMIWTNRFSKWKPKHAKA